MFKRFIGRNFMIDGTNIRHRGLLRESVQWRWLLHLWTTWYPLSRRPLK